MHLDSLKVSGTQHRHSAPPVAQQPQKDRDFLQNALNEKAKHAAPASWSARYHPFGEGHGQTAWSSDLCRGASRTCKNLQHRSCSGKICTESARQHPTPKYGPSKKNRKPADHLTRPHSPPDSTQWGAVLPNKNLETIRQQTPSRTHKG